MSINEGKKITKSHIEGLRKAGVKDIAITDEALEAAYAAADIVDPATGDFGNATVIRKFGDVPDDLSAL